MQYENYFLHLIYLVVTGPPTGSYDKVFGNAQWIIRIWTNVAIYNREKSENWCRTLFVATADINISKFELNNISYSNS